MTRTAALNTLAIRAAEAGDNSRALDAAQQAVNILRPLVRARTGHRAARPSCPSSAGRSRPGRCQIAITAATAPAPAIPAMIHNQRRPVRRAGQSQKITFRPISGWRPAARYQRRTIKRQPTTPDDCRFSTRINEQWRH
jgi:hypothetical protein